MASLPPLIEAANQVQTLALSQGWRFCFIGGLALIARAEPRFTQDVDLTLLTGLGKEQEYLAIIAQHILPRRVDALQFALQSRVYLGRANNGVNIDLGLGWLPYEERAIERADDCEIIANCWLRVASAEDLLILKAFASRGQDWIDVESIICRHNDQLDWALIEQELSILAEMKEEPQIMQELWRRRQACQQRLKQGREPWEWN